jgi:hypothetical protein
MGKGASKMGELSLAHWLIAAAVILASPTAEAQQPGALTLACKGTTTDSLTPDEKTPVSMGIIVNFNTRTVQGFGDPGLIDYPVKITGANDVTIAFEGHQLILSGTSLSATKGSMDRVTGDVEADVVLFDPKTNKQMGKTSYALKCKPTERMF